MKALIAGITVLLLAGFTVFFIKSRGGEMVMNTELDEKLVQPYVSLSAAGEYQQAYKLLSKDYRKEVSLEEFSRGHLKRKQEKGVITSIRMIRDEVLYNLFSSRRNVRLYYEIYYGEKRETGWIQLTEDEKDFFTIDGTYRETASGSLEFVLW